MWGAIVINVYTKNVFRICYIWRLVRIEYHGVPNSSLNPMFKHYALVPNRVGNPRGPIVIKGHGSMTSNPVT